jgi:formimidoylglutamate deiminase
LHQRRNVAASAAERRVGDTLWRGALGGGAKATGRRVGALAAGQRADLLVLDSAHPNLFGLPPADVLNALVFCGNDNLVRDVLVGGRWVVLDGNHIAQAAIAQRYMHTIEELRTLRS